VVTGVGGFGVTGAGAFHGVLPAAAVGEIRTLIGDCPAPCMVRRPLSTIFCSQRGNRILEGDGAVAAGATTLVIVSGFAVVVCVRGVRVRVARKRAGRGGAGARTAGVRGV
jgi:hypothetical protein